MKKLYLIALLFFVLSSVKSQDTQYWTQQFGTRSALMSGAVIASSRDNSSLFYSPGSLGWIDTASLSINATAYQSENIKIKNALGRQADLKSNQIGSTPLLIGGMIRTHSEKTRIAYGLITPTNFSFKAIGRAQGEFPLIDDSESPGNEPAIAQASIQTKLSELGAGIGIGRKISSSFGVGITGMFIARSLDYNNNRLVRLYMNQPSMPLVTATLIQNVDYFNVRFAPRIGLGYEKGNWQAGLTITSPSVNLFGTGNIGFDATATNIKPPSENSRIDFVANDRQEKLKSTYKSPFSIAGGIGYSHQRSHIEMAVQYYGKIDMYSIINADSSAFARPANVYPELTSDKYLRVLTAARPVFNVALAYEYRLKQNLLMYLSCRSDQTFFDKAITRQTGIKPDISSWNIYHLVAGTTWQKGKSGISIGLTAAFGADKHREETGDIDGGNESNFFTNSLTVTEAKYSNIGLLIGYTYHFSKF